MNGSHIAIPTILKVGKGTLKDIGSYIKDSRIENAVVYFGNGLVDMFGDTVLQSFQKENINVLEYKELDSIKIEDIIDLAFSIDSKAQIIVGIGGGKVIDAAKYAAYLRKLPFISVPTSASSDGFSSASASLLVNGRRTSVPAKLAYGIIADTDVIKSAKVSARITFLDKPIIKRFVPISLSLLVIILLSSSSSISAYLTIGPSI